MTIELNNRTEKVNLPPNIRVLSESELAKEGLATFRQLVYAVYTHTGQPTDFPIFPNHRPKTRSQYLLLTQPDNQLTKPVPQNLTGFQDSLASFRHIAAFFKIETANLPTQPPEAEQLFSWAGWRQKKTIAYLSEFSPHPQLDKAHKLAALTTLFSAYEKIKRHPTYIILNDHVASFVAQIEQVRLQPINTAKLRHTQYTQTLFSTFPGYWNNNPQLYSISFT